MCQASKMLLRLSRIVPCRRALVVVVFVFAFGVVRPIVDAASIHSGRLNCRQAFLRAAGVEHRRGRPAAPGRELYCT